MSVKDDLRSILFRSTATKGTVVGTGPNGLAVRTRNGVKDMKSVGGEFIVGQEVEVSNSIILRGIDAEAGLPTYHV